MKFLNKLEKKFRDFTFEFSSPESFMKDKEFEEYVKTTMFTDFPLISSKRCNCDTDKCYKNCQIPIFEFKDVKTEKQFHVEVQWRNEFYCESKVTWCTEKEFDKLKSLEKKGEDVFVALGLGGLPKRPNKIVFFPMTSCDTTALLNSFIRRFIFLEEKEMTSNLLWKLR